MVLGRTFLKHQKNGFYDVLEKCFREHSTRFSENFLVMQQTGHRSSIPLLRMVHDTNAFFHFWIRWCTYYTLYTKEILLGQKTKKQQKEEEGGRKSGPRSSNGTIGNWTSLISGRVTLCSKRSAWWTSGNK